MSPTVIEDCSIIHCNYQNEHASKELIQMQRNPSNFFEWTQKHLTQEACLEELNRCCWKNEFIYHKRTHLVLLTTGTNFEPMRMPRTKRFVATCLMGVDKDRFSKMTGVGQCVFAENTSLEIEVVGKKLVISAIECRETNMGFMSEC